VLFSSGTKESSSKLLSMSWIIVLLTGHARFLDFGFAFDFLAANLLPLLAVELELVASLFGMLLFTAPSVAAALVVDFDFLLIQL